MLSPWKRLTTESYRRSQSVQAPPRETLRIVSSWDEPQQIQQICAQESSIMKSDRSEEWLIALLKTCFKPQTPDCQMISTANFATWLKGQGKLSARLLEFYVLGRHWNATLNKSTLFLNLLGCWFAQWLLAHSVRHSDATFAKETVTRSCRLVPPMTTMAHVFMPKSTDCCKIRSLAHEYISQYGYMWTHVVWVK